MDTNAIMTLQKSHTGLLTRMSRQRIDDFAIPSIVAFEMFFGDYRGPRTLQNLARIEVLPFEILDCNAEDARRAGEVRAILAAAGAPIGPYDVLIAGQTLSRDLTLITHNTRAFRRLPELQIED